MTILSDANGGSNASTDRVEETKLASTVTNISISPELFEKLYLSPKVPHAVESATRFANAAPLGFLGFTISTFTFSMITMGWGGASGLTPVLGIFFFVGPILLLLATIFLWIQGQFFTMMACALFSVFWLSFGLLQVPSLGLAAAYAPPGTDPALAASVGAASKEFNAVLGLYLMVWGFAVFTFWLFTLRINVIFASMFGLVFISAFTLSGAYFRTSVGDLKSAQALTKTSGALLFVVAALGWYGITAQIAVEMRVRWALPVGDLSHFWSSTDIELGQLENDKKD